MFGSVFVDPNFVCVMIGEHEVFEDGLLVHHCRGEPLIRRADLGLETYHMKIELFAGGDAFEEVGKAMLVAAGEKYSKCVLLLDTELHKLYLCSDQHVIMHLIEDLSDYALIPPAFPRTWLLLLNALTSGS